MSNDSSADRADAADSASISLKNELKVKSGYLRAAVAGIAGLLGVTPTIIDIAAQLNMTLLEKVLAGFTLLFGFLLAVSAWLLFSVIRKSNDRIEELRMRSQAASGDTFWAKASLYAIAAIVLANDRGNGWADRHFHFDNIYRKVDQRGEFYAFESEYEGYVIEGPIDHIPIRFDSDFELGSDEIDTTVQGEIEYQNGETESFECEAEEREEKSGPYDVVLELPFGEERYVLDKNDKFKLEFKGDPFGRTNTRNTEIHVHFPLYRLDNVDEFSADVILPRRFDDCQGAKLSAINPDTHRQCIVLEQLNYDELEPGEEIQNLSDGEFRLKDKGDAADLYVTRFVER